MEFVIASHIEQHFHIFLTARSLTMIFCLGGIYLQIDIYLSLQNSLSCFLRGSLMSKLCSVLRCISAFVLFTFILCASENDTSTIHEPLKEKNVRTRRVRFIERG